MKRIAALVLLLAAAPLYAAYAAPLPLHHPIDVYCTQYTLATWSVSGTGYWSACTGCHTDPTLSPCGSCHYYSINGTYPHLAWLSCLDCHTTDPRFPHEARLLCTQGRGGVPPPTINITLHAGEVHAAAAVTYSSNFTEWVAANYGYPAPVSCTCHAFIHRTLHRPTLLDFPVNGYATFNIPGNFSGNGSKPGGYWLTIYRYVGYPTSAPWGVLVGLMLPREAGFITDVFLAHCNRSTAVLTDYYHRFNPVEYSSAEARSNASLAVEWAWLGEPLDTWVEVNASTPGGAVAYNRLIAYACMTCHFNATVAGVSPSPGGSRIQLPPPQLVLPEERLNEATTTSVGGVERCCGGLSPPYSLLFYLPLLAALLLLSPLFRRLRFTH